MSDMLWGGELGWVGAGGLARMGDELKRRLAENAELRARAEAAAWRPIETAPKDEHTAVMLISETGWIYIGVYWSCYNGWVDREEFMRLPPITHWMPLPEAPDQKGDTP